MKTCKIAIIRTYLCNGVTGVVYTLDGSKCSMLMKKNRSGSQFAAWIEAADVAAKLGVALAVTTAAEAVDALQAAGLRARVWSQPKSNKVRVYVADGGKDRGYLDFDGLRWTWDNVSSAGNAKQFREIAGLAA